MGIGIDRFHALKAIDAHASAARRRFVTDTPGQSAVYAAKHRQALEYIAANATSKNAQVPGYIAAEATATGKDPVRAAQAIIAKAQAWDEVTGPAIEGIRIAAKLALGKAQTTAEIDAIVAAAVRDFSDVR